MTPRGRNLNVQIKTRSGLVILTLTGILAAPVVWSTSALAADDDSGSATQSQQTDTQQTGGGDSLLGGGSTGDQSGDSLLQDNGGSGGSTSNGSDGDQSSGSLLGGDSGSSDSGGTLLQGGGSSDEGSGGSLLGGGSEGGDSGGSLLQGGSGGSESGGTESGGSLLEGGGESGGSLLGGESGGETEQEKPEEVSGKTPEEMHAALFVKDRYPSATECAGCHPRQYKQWSMSQHAYAQMSPIFNAMQGRISQLTNGTLGDFCIRCHTPVGMNIGENEFMSNIDRSPTSREGITCVVCHRISKPYGKVSGRLAIEEGPITDPVYGPTGNNEQIKDAIERGVVKTDPKSFGRKIHREAKRFFQISTASFCGSCHDVLQPGNFRLEDAFSEWKHSPAAEKGATCQDCHMGNIPGALAADPSDPDFIKKNYPFGPAAMIGSKGTEPRKLTNHYFAGPDYTVLPPSLFPLNVKAIKEESEKGDPTARGLATIRDWLKFDWKAGWGTDAFEEKVFKNPDKYQFPDRWASADSRYTARDIIQENLESLRFMRNRRLQVMRHAFGVSPIEVEKADSDGIAFKIKVTNISGGGGAPTGFDGERLFWLHVKVTDSDGKVVFESGDPDPNGDVRDLHSRYVHNHELPLDRQLFNLQSKFLARTVRGPEREQVLAVPYAATPLPFINRPTRAGVLFGQPAASRKHRQGILAGDHRWAEYKIDGSELTGKGPYNVVAELKAQMIPVNLIIEILKVGFDYNLDARTIARRDVHGYVDDNGDRAIWNPESSDPDDNKVIGNEVLYRREATIDVGS